MSRKTVIFILINTRTQNLNQTQMIFLNEYNFSIYSIFLLELQPEDLSTSHTLRLGNLYTSFETVCAARLKQLMDENEWVSEWNS